MYRLLRYRAYAKYTDPRPQPVVAARSARDVWARSLVMGMVYAACAKDSYKHSKVVVARLEVKHDRVVCYQDFVYSNSSTALNVHAVLVCAPFMIPMSSQVLLPSIVLRQIANIRLFPR